MANSAEVVALNGASIVGWAEVVDRSGLATPQQLSEARAAAEAQFTPET